MRTNIVIDDDLMTSAMAVTGAATKREVVELGLKTLLRLQHQKDLKQLRGRVDWTGDLEMMRTDG
ncbi:type II toxin-antitoxin system VapB family antitoxin [uncultured Jannaschia sp.]|uniref:type II toxin-antitoxin system VapB family antitoxin n=1 Tax=uncultured Jannaschia sp. TaxID=293347 RepID=UPI002601BEE2|nr:type II toxin-antitoxin system VapB family antitoxin [uncultured Jannaschia sp.]